MSRLDTRPTAGPPVVQAPAYPRRRGLVIALSVFVGFLLTVVWSAQFVDRVIGDNVANTLLGHEAREATIGGTVAGAVFAFVTGLAGTFTACNIAVFGAVAPAVGGARPTARERLLATLRPLGWLAAGMVAVSATYGAIVAIAGTGMPQFSTATQSTGLSARSIQSMVVFGLIGLALTYLGLAALGVVRDPLRNVSARFPGAYPLVLGALIGAFLVGRPFGLFRMLFRDAAESGNVLYGALTFVLQSLGNVVIVAVLVLLLVYGTGGRFQRWLNGRPGRLAAITGSALIIAGVFTFLYWVLRLLARRDIIWFPMAPWT